ncbi:MAG: hypothetical protein WCZ68_07645 [Sedimentibacter sp.]
MKYVAAEIARIRNISIDEVAQKTKENFKRLFGLS